MKYNAKYDRWVTTGGLVYRYSKGQDKLVLCKLIRIGKYLYVGFSKPKNFQVSVHRLVFETFVGEIKQGYEIDHINTVTDDNRLENLRQVTPKENKNNPLTIKHSSDSQIRTEFGRKFKEHFGFLPYEDQKLYYKERAWYLRHNKCRWE